MNRTFVLRQYGLTAVPVHPVLDAMDPLAGSIAISRLWIVPHQSNICLIFITCPCYRTCQSHRDNSRWVNTPRITCADWFFLRYFPLEHSNVEAYILSKTPKVPKKSVRDEKSDFGKDRRRKHHHYLVTVNYADGESFGRVYTDKDKASRFAERQRRSPVVKSARVSQVS
jgi:hypothetical protein